MKTVEYYCDTCKKTYYIKTDEPIMPREYVCIKCNGQVWRRGVKDEEEKPS